MTTKRGTLTIAGSGIASIGHITLETLSYIKESSKVYFLVADPATKAFIQDNASVPCINLTVYYDKNKCRYDSYVQMSEVMLMDVRSGHNVLGVFYGHPGVFVSPSHRAIAIAREEGYKARMLPGVSAEDYMFADLGFDPATGGCVSYEATELLIRNKPLNPSGHSIIWQVGSVGVSTMVFDNAKFHLLVDRLEQDYGSEHKVVHYIGAVLPQQTSIVDVFTIAELRKPDVVKQFNTISTLYVPPRDAGAVSSSMIERLGMAKIGGPQPKLSFPSPKWAGPAESSVPIYGPYEKAVIAQLASHTTPEGYKVLNASTAMKQFMKDLALNPSCLAEYKDNAPAVVDAVVGLTRQEKNALRLGRGGPIYEVMEATESDIAQGRELSADELATLADSSNVAVLIGPQIILLVGTVTDALGAGSALVATA